MLCSHFMHKMTRGMTKIHPNAANSAITTTTNAAADDCDNNIDVKPSFEGNESGLIVWKKSLMFNCYGYTVFDSKGNLVFRVDNYMASHSHEIVLMDAYGSPLFTIRRKRLSIGDNWLVYEGETAVNPRYSVRKHMNFLNTKSLARVNNSSGGGLCYEIEGSYAQRCCTVLDDNSRKVAEIKKKEAAVGGAAFGTDVFRLIVQPEFDSALAMALVILLDQMFGSSKRFSP